MYVCMYVCIYIYYINLANVRVSIIFHVVEIPLFLHVYAIYLLRITIRLYTIGKRMIGWQEYAPAEWREVIYKFFAILQETI